MSSFFNDLKLPPSYCPTCTAFPVLKKYFENFTCITADSPLSQLATWMYPVNAESGKQYRSCEYPSSFRLEILEMIKKAHLRFRSTHRLEDFLYELWFQFPRLYVSWNVLECAQLKDGDSGWVVRLHLDIKLVRDAGWWVLVSCHSDSTDLLSDQGNSRVILIHQLSSDRVANQDMSTLSMDFDILIPSELIGPSGSSALVLYLVSDSHLGLDQCYRIPVSLN
jgi:hypothetical protein